MTAKGPRHDDSTTAWAEACERAIRSMEMAHANYKGETAIEEAQRLLGLAHHLCGVACPQCGGEGRRCYPSTSTWRGGISGQAITEGVCDMCWGTGRTDRTGVNLRKLHSEHYTLDTRLLRWRELARKMADLISTACPDSSVWTDVGGLAEEYDRLETTQSRRIGPGAYPSKHIKGEAYFARRRGMNPWTTKRDREVYEAVCADHKSLDALRQKLEPTLPGYREPSDSWIRRSLGRLRQHKLLRFNREQRCWEPVEEDNNA